MIRMNGWHWTVIAMMTLVIFVVGISITSCGTSASSGSSTPTVGARGIAVDPYVVGARFLEDLNNNGQWDTGEQLSTLTDSNGVFTFANALTTTSTLLLDRTVTATHNGVTYTGNIKRIVDSITATLVASPLTTLLANGWTEIEIIDVLSTAGLTGLTASDLTANPMEGIENLTTVTEAELVKIRASIAIYSFMTVMDTLISGQGYDINYTTFSNTATARPALKAMVDSINYCLSPTLLTTIQSQMSGGGVPPGTPQVTVGDIIRASVAVTNYVIPQVVAAPTTFIPNATTLSILGNKLGVNFYVLRNKSIFGINLLISGINTGMGAGTVITNITSYNSLEVDGGGNVVGVQ
ncbi:MAG: hypothetical protein V1871_01570 [Planctomycetota bacterium]